VSADPSGKPELRMMSRQARTVKQADTGSSLGRNTHCPPATPPVRFLGRFRRMPQIMAELGLTSLRVEHSQQPGWSRSYAKIREVAGSRPYEVTDI
jgi:hypothetical protein